MMEMEYPGETDLQVAVVVPLRIVVVDVPAAFVTAHIDAVAVRVQRFARLLPKVTEEPEILLSSPLYFIWEYISSKDGQEAPFLSCRALQSLVRFCIPASPKDRTPSKIKP